MNRFRCQYQKGEKTYASEIIESETPITSAQIIFALSKLAITVRDTISKRKGGKVAFQVLKIHEYVMKSIHGKDNIGNGPIQSFYLDRRNKNKINRSERVDIEFYGDFGEEDLESPVNSYIKHYRKLKHWDIQ